MKTITEFLLEGKANYDGAEKLLVKFCKKVDSVWHAPTKKEHIKRMEPFAKDAELVEYGNTMFGAYFAECNQFEPINGFSQYDIKGAWYVFAFLVIAPKPQSSIDMVIQSFCDTSHADLAIVRRILHLAKAEQHQQRLEKVEAYFSEVNKSSMAYRWMASLGVEPPKTYDWEMVFRLEAKPVERKEFCCVDNLMLTVNVGEPKGDGESFRIKLADRERKVSHDWSDGDTKAKVKCKEDRVALKSNADLLSLKQLIEEIEGVYQLRFERKFHFSYFTKGFKNKGKVQKWITD